jgi:hypothetical protein
VSAVDVLRTLPLRIELGAGEAIDSWLLRLAHRNGIRLLRLTAALGFGDRLTVWRNYALTWKLPPVLLRRIETQTALPAAALDTAVLDQFDVLGWKPIPGSRFCPACLHESGGRWPIRWQLPHTFACTVHRCLLAVLCPACGRTPHSRISERSGLAPSTFCTLGTTRHGTRCDGDLLSRPAPRPLDPTDQRLSAQTWVNTRLDRMDAAAVTDLRDLNALATWFRQRIHPSELERLGDDTVIAMSAHRDDHHGLKRHPPTAALIAAAMACQAVSVIIADDSNRPPLFAPLLRDVYTKYRTSSQSPSARGPMILSHRRITSLSEPLRRRILTSIDTQLPASERLRYRTCTGTPSPPTPSSSVAAERARHIPQYLWPDWIIRFLPQRGSHVTDIAIGIPVALLIPGNPARNIHATDELNPWRNNTSIFLSTTAEQHPGTLPAICALADYLDTHGSPIDYRRRRVTFTDVTLTLRQWHDISYHTGTEPGRDGRLRHVRRYLLHLLTGADLNNPQHRLAFTTASDKTDYFNRFHRNLHTTLGTALHDHAAHLLELAGINEPVTWSPPADCIAGLDIPGRHPHDIDVATVQRLLHVNHLSLSAAARRLGVTVEHVRFAEQRIDRPLPTLHPMSRNGARRNRERAATLLTSDFFEREYLDAGRTLHDLASTTGMPYLLVARQARVHGIPVSNRGRTTVPARPDRHPRPTRRRRTAPKRHTRVTGRRTPIDPQWLREQAETLHRTNGDIGAELGLSHETVRRHRKRLGIADHPSGAAGHTVQTRRHPDLHSDIRRAVEGKRHGWQRLRRFQQAAEHPSINAAANALGLYHQNLFLQLDRLEADIGAALIDRTDNRYRAMTPTSAGRRLLDQLRQPNVRQLLDRYAPAPNQGHHKRKVNKRC